jgi:hypothetical protein
VARSETTYPELEALKTSYHRCGRGCGQAFGMHRRFDCEICTTIRKKIIAVGWDLARQRVSLDCGGHRRAPLELLTRHGQPKTPIEKIAHNGVAPGVSILFPHA